MVAPDLVARRMPVAEAFPSPESPETRDQGPWHFGWIPYDAPGVEPMAHAASTRDVVVFDGHQWSVPVGSGVAPEWLDSLLDDASAAPFPPDPPVAWDEGDRGAHERGVLDCLDAIRAGEVYQACLSTRFHGTVDRASAGSTVAAAAVWWARRVAKHEPVRAAFLAGVDDDGRDVVVASLSPEEFLVRDGATVRESPIKGTVPLTADPGALAASRKDVAENIMIVDLVRHDLGQVAATGGVRVTDLLSVHPAPGVWHLVSEVTATLPAGLAHADLVDACFPPASVTGTPKIRAAELIAEWEPEQRGVHCGAVGAAVGDRSEFNVAIRTAEFRGPGPGLGAGDAADAAAPITVAAGVGGGITVDSDPAAEWAEIMAKAAPLLGRA